MQVIHTALLSFGMSGKVFHAPFLQLHPGFELTGAWERSNKVIGDHYSGVKSYSTMEELLSDPIIDLVIVNTPTYTHYEYAKIVLQAGKHAVVEKAFTGTAAEAEELKELAEHQGKKISVFQNRRWDSDFKTVQQMVRDGLLGDVVEATFCYDRYNPQLSPKAHKETPSSGSGVVMDLGPHLIDQALVLFGMPQSVFADVRVTRPHSKVVDYFEILLYYPHHRVRLHSGYFVREPAPSFIVHGTKGSFLKTRADVQETRLQAGHKPGQSDWGIEPESEQGLLHTEKDGRVIREKVKSLPGNYLAYYEGIYKALVEDKPMPVTVDDGINVMRIIEATMKSSNERRVVDLGVGLPTEAFAGK